MRIRLIEDWRGSWRLLSTWLAAAWSCVLGWCFADPTVLTTLWMALPEDLRADLPSWARGLILGGIAFSTWYAARVIKQPALRKPGGAP